MDWATGKGQPYLYYCYGVGCTEVEIDTLTGDFKVRHAVLTLLNISPAVI